MRRAAAYKVEPLPGGAAFGALIRDLADEALDDPSVRAELRALWLDRGVLVIQGPPSDQATHVRLAACFGEVEIHPLRVPRPDLLPQVTSIVSDEADGDIYEVDGKMLHGWLPWHFDLCYSDRINHGAVLRPVALPPVGGRTGFIDQISAYAALPGRLKRAIEGLSVVYEMEFDASRMRFGRGADVRLVRMQSRTRRFRDRAHELPRAVHPMIYRQPETGRPVLHVSPWFAAGIEGDETPEGDALLAEVIAHCTAREAAYFHRWRADEYVVWDNWRMMHCATGIPPGHSRHMHRVGIAGDIGLGRIERPEMVMENAPVV